MNYYGLIFLSVGELANFNVKGVVSNYLISSFIIFYAKIIGHGC